MPLARLHPILPLTPIDYSFCILRGLLPAQLGSTITPSQSPHPSTFDRYRIGSQPSMAGNSETSG